MVFNDWTNSLSFAIIPLVIELYMKYTELKASLKQKLENIYLIFGEDRYLCFDALKKIQDAATINITDMNAVTISGENVTVKDIVASASIYPFGDTYRLVIVKNFALTKDKAEKEELEKYLADPLSSTILVFFNPDGAESFKNFANITKVDCNKIEPKYISAFIKNNLKEQGLDATDEAIDKLILFTNCDMTRITSELEKLSAYAFKTKMLTEDMVEKFVVQDEEYEVFQLSELLAKGDSKKAFALLDSFMVKPGSAFMLISPLYSTYRRALFVSINKDKTVSELSSLLGVKEYAIKMLKTQLAAFSPKKLKAIVDMIALYDKKIKTGEMKETIAIKTIASNILNIRG